MRRKGALLYLGRPRERFPGPKNPRRSFLFLGPLLGLGLGLLLSGCASAPPFSITLGAMGANATFSTPGWSETVPIKKSDVAAPVLMVPPGSVPATITPTTVATVIPAASPPSTVPDTKAVLKRQAVASEKSIRVIEAPVSSPVLAVPK